MPVDNTLLQLADIVDKSHGTISVLKSTFGKNSINRMAKNTMLQTPVIGDNSIDKQTLVTATKAIERYTAALLMSVFSMNPYVSLKKFGDVGQYIRTIYDNEKSPIALPSTDSDVSVTEATIYGEGEVKIDPVVGYEYLIGTEASLNMDSLNDMYNESKMNIAQMKSTLKALEAVSTDNVVKKVDDLSGVVKGSGLHNNTMYDAGLHGGNAPKSSYQAPQLSDAKGSLDPTIMTVNFVVGTENGNTSINVVIGVQGVLRTLRYEDMVETLTVASTGAVGAYKFIKYLKGERGLADFLLGVADAKSIARPKTIGEKVLSNLQVRKKNRSFKNLAGGAKPLPITWLVVSQAAVDEVNHKKGIDLSQPYFASKMMNEYYFLGFMIIDEAMGSVKIMVDGDNTFSETTLSSLNKVGSHKYDANEIKQLSAFFKTF